MSVYFHRYSGVLRGYLTEHTEEFWAKAWRSQPHGGQVGKGCFCPKLWTGKFCIPGGWGEYLTYCPLVEKKKEFAVSHPLKSFKDVWKWTNFFKSTTKNDLHGVTSLDSRSLGVWRQYCSYRGMLPVHETL